MMHLLLSQIDIQTDKFLQYGSFGLVALIVLGVGFYFAPKVLAAIENIAPTLAKQMEAQDVRHAAWMEEVEGRHVTERREMRDLIDRLMPDRTGSKDHGDNGRKGGRYGNQD